MQSYPCALPCECNGSIIMSLLASNNVINICMCLDWSQLSWFRLLTLIKSVASKPDCSKCCQCRGLLIPNWAIACRGSRNWCEGSSKLSCFSSAVCLCSLFFSKFTSFLSNQRFWAFSMLKYILFNNFRG